MSNSSTQNVQRSSSNMPKSRDEDNATKASDLAEACDTMVQAAASYSRKHPAVVMLCTFMAGFYVGWKVKPW